MRLYASSKTQNSILVNELSAVDVTPDIPIGNQDVHVPGRAFSRAYCPLRAPARQ